MPAGIGGGGWLALTFETTMGTYLPPTTAGTLWIPILSEDLRYREDKYFSPQIRQQTIVSDVEQAPYHVEGDIRLEVDAQFLPHLMYCSRHIIVKDAVTYVGDSLIAYKFTPGQQGSASTHASGATTRTASITIVRNGIGFGYAGVTFGGYVFTIENGVLVVTLNAFGLSEEDPAGLGSPSWVDSQLFGASAHSVYVAAAGASPTFAGADVNFEGFTFTNTFNAAAQNRLTPSRAATYISYGETDGTYSSNLDFVDKTEYTSMKNATRRAIRLESLRGPATWATATSGVRIDINNSVYTDYPVNLGAMGDLIMAQSTGRAIGVAGGDAYSISVKSAVDIT